MSTKWEPSASAAAAEAAETQVSSLTEGLIFPASTWRSAVQQGSGGITPVCRVGYRSRWEPRSQSITPVYFKKNNSHYITATSLISCACVWQEEIDGEDGRMTRGWLQGEQKLRSVKESGTRCGNRFNLMLPLRLPPLLLCTRVCWHIGYCLSSRAGYRNKGQHTYTHTHAETLSNYLERAPGHWESHYIIITPSTVKLQRKRKGRVELGREGEMVWRLRGAVDETKKKNHRNSLAAQPQRTRGLREKNFLFSNPAFFISRHAFKGLLLLLKHAVSEETQRQLARRDSKRPPGMRDCRGCKKKEEKKKGWG